MCTNNPCDISTNIMDKNSLDLPPREIKVLRERDIDKIIQDLS